jgi:hypothetical protein
MWLILMSLLAVSKPQALDIKELHEREVAVSLKTSLNRTASPSAIKKCLPSRAKEFPSSWSTELDALVFTKKEMKDLKDCRVSDCAFRFRQDERAEINRAKSEDEIKKLVHRFFSDRRKSQVEPYAHELELRIQNSETAFDFCQSPEFDKLLQNRSHPRARDLFEVFQYDDRMRPTARMSRGLSFEDKKKWTCWSEALVFSTHYEVDRVELWGIKNEELRLSVRQRLDFLHSWWRRLRKNELREPLQNWARDEIQIVANCLNSQK